jgi:hypothetical protein
MTSSGIDGLGCGFDAEYENGRGCDLDRDVQWKPPKVVGFVKQRDPMHRDRSRSTAYWVEWGKDG